MNGHNFSIAKATRFVLFELFQGVSTILIAPPLRRLWWVFFGAKIGVGTTLLRSCVTNGYHYGLSRVKIGQDCFLGNGVDLDVRGGITLEDQVTISNGVSIVTHINVGFDDHPLQKAYPCAEQPVVIKRGAYIATGAILLPGITVGKSAVVGAGAVVTHDVAPNTVVAGAPARVIKTIHP